MNAQKKTDKEKEKTKSSNKNLYIKTGMPNQKNKLKFPVSWINPARGHEYSAKPLT
jgi:hypothetical protein